MTDKAGFTIPKTVLLHAQQLVQCWGTLVPSGVVAVKYRGGRNVIASARARGAVDDTAVKLGLALE